MQCVIENPELHSHVFNGSFQPWRMIVTVMRSLAQALPHTGKNCKVLRQWRDYQAIVAGGADKGKCAHQKEQHSCGQ